MFQILVESDAPLAELTPVASPVGGRPGLAACATWPQPLGPSPGSPRHHSPAGSSISLRSGMRYDQLLAYIEHQPSLSILEIGVARAANAIRMLGFADALGGTPHYTGIDLFGRLTAQQLADSYCIDAKQPATLSQTLSRLRSVLGPEVSGRVKLCEGLSGEILPVLRQRGCQYDLIFVDGGHDYEAVSGDWRLCQDLVAPGGVVVFDDFPNWGVAGAVAEIDRRRWSVRLLDHVDIFENHRRDECPAARRMHLLVEVNARAAE